MIRSFIPDEYYNFKIEEYDKEIEEEYYNLIEKIILVILKSKVHIMNLMKELIQIKYTFDNISNVNQHINSIFNIKSEMEKYGKRNIEATTSLFKEAYSKISELNKNHCRKDNNSYYSKNSINFNLNIISQNSISEYCNNIIIKDFGIISGYESFADNDINNNLVENIKIEKNSINEQNFVEIIEEINKSFDNIQDNNVNEINDNNDSEVINQLEEQLCKYEMRKFFNHLEIIKEADLSDEDSFENE